MMSTRRLSPLVAVLLAAAASGQPTYVNAVIPGDHPDPTLTRVGDDFYTSGSSFNVTPTIYHSTDLVHWRVIAQPVAADWPLYGDSPAGGVWGGHMVAHGGRYWHVFGRGTGDRAMYFVTADQPEGPWSEPVRMTVPPDVPGFGVDNSVFVDTDGRWFLVTKNGQSVNYVVELGADGQAAGEVLNLSWLNPAPALPYGWAEGPVMWTHDGYYYYSFAQHLAGNQYVMRSAVRGAPLSDEPSAWETPRVLFTGSRSAFGTPNHSSPAVTASDGTSWVISQSYDGSGSGEWQALGRQGILSQIVYDGDGWPTATYPNGAEAAPDLPSSGIPWTVPRSDRFDTTELAPDWSFLGFTPDGGHSLTARPGWLRLTPTGGSAFPPIVGETTVVQNAAEHAYTLVTRVDFDPESSDDEAGLWTFNGSETLVAKVFLSSDTGDVPVVVAFFDDAYTGVAPIETDGPVWLRLARDGHSLTSAYSLDGTAWTALSTVNVARMDRHQPVSEGGMDYNAFTGNQQGLYVRGAVPADFDLYVYRDAYAPIPARYPSNANGVAPSASGYLGSIHDGDWAMYAGVEFGQGNEDSADSPFSPRGIEITASSAAAGGTIEVRLDSLDGALLATVEVPSTGGWSTPTTTTAEVARARGQHDVFLRFRGGAGELLRLHRFGFAASSGGTATEAGASGALTLHPPFPNPFGAQPATISYTLPHTGPARLTVLNVLGQTVATLVDGVQPAGRHEIMFDGRGLASGVYVCHLETVTATARQRVTLVR